MTSDVARGGRASIVDEMPLTPGPTLTCGLSASPDGKFLLHTALRPDHFSFAVPWSRFGSRVELLNLAEKDTHPVLLQDASAVESLPIGHDAVRTGPRGLAWRPDRAASLYWAEALDGGDPKVKPDHGARDAVYMLEAPFDSQPVELARTATRYQHVRWGGDGAALVWERWYHSRKTIVSRLPPGGCTAQMEPYMQYDFSDVYQHPGYLLLATHYLLLTTYCVLLTTYYMQYDFSDLCRHPGTPLMEEGPFGRSVLRRHGSGGLLWTGNGASEEGARPFIDERGYEDGVKRRRLWRGAVGCYDDPDAVLAPLAAGRVAPGAVQAGALLVFMSRRQTQTQPPQLLLRAVSAVSAAAADEDSVEDSSEIIATLNDPPHPQPLLQGVTKQLIKYNRADGCQLSGTLYTPQGYDALQDGTLPTILWAYPREYKSKTSAGRVHGSEHSFTTVSWGSPLFWLSRGYAILDGFAAPIVGEGDTPENDNYVSQLVMNAEAAVAELRRRGVSDHRLAIGGHSYGAFMTANLLARTGYRMLVTTSYAMLLRTRDHLLLTHEQ